MHFQPGVPLRSICKGKGKGEGKGERKKEKKKGKGERRKEKNKRRTDTREGRDIHPPYFCGSRHLCQNVLPMCFRVAPSMQGFLSPKFPSLRI